MNRTVRLHYGQNGLFEAEIASERVALYQPAPEPCTNFVEQLRDRLQVPLELPAFRHFFTPGDRIALALDRHTPESPRLVAALWEQISAAGIEPDTVTILQPAGLDGVPQPDPRNLLPPEVSERLQWRIHDATDERLRAYLASTARGDRVYLARELVEADVVISVGVIAYDAVAGYRGTSSVFYPGLSSVDAIKKLHGQGHSELGPEDERPLRQEMDEVAWLLGNMFTIQVIPARAHGVVEVLAGSNEAVLAHGQELLAQEWRVSLPERVPTVVISIDEDDAGETWSHLGAALETARNVVTKGGRIVVLSQLRGETTPGLDILRSSRDARAALQPLAKAQPPDMVAAMQIARAADWAKVYLLSRLDPALTEDLFLFPVDNEKQVHRLLSDGGPCAFIESAQHTYGEIMPKNTRPTKRTVRE
jgi:nickel-dependent lactate racemase